MYKSDSFVKASDLLNYEFDKLVEDGFLDGLLATTAPAPRVPGARRPHLKAHAKSVKDKATLGSRRRRDYWDMRDYYPNDPSLLLVGDESYVTRREGLLAKRELLVEKLCAKRAEISDLSRRADALLRESQNIAALRPRLLT